MYLLQETPPGPYAPLPVRSAVVLDPWLEPVPLPSPDTGGPPPKVPFLVISSPRFTGWNDHFQRVLNVCQEAEAGLITLLGASRTFIILMIRL